MKYASSTLLLLASALGVQADFAAYAVRFIGTGIGDNGFGWIFAHGQADYDTIKHTHLFPTSKDVSKQTGVRTAYQDGDHLVTLEMHLNDHFHYSECSK